MVRGRLIEAVPGVAAGPQRRAIVCSVAIGRSTRRWAAIVGLGLGVACGEAAPSAPLPPYALSLDLSSVASREGRDRAAWVREVVSSELSRRRWFRDAAEGPMLPAHLSYDELRSDEGVPVLRVYLAVDPEDDLRAQLDAIESTLDAYVELERRDQTVDLQRDLPVAVERCLALLEAKITVAVGTADEVGARLEDDDVEIVLIALDAVERRGLRELDDAVYALLGHADERVAMQAVECLGVVGGPQHAPGLLRSARLADRAHAQRLYEALANLGGQHARGFLQFAARNEEDPELATWAEHALARVEARQPAPTLSPAVTRGHRQ